METTQMKKINPATEKGTLSQPGKILPATTVIWPLRVFLGLSFVAAGLDKLFDPRFLDPDSFGYIGRQLKGFAGVSPIGWFLNEVAVPNSTFFGIWVMLGELAIGLGTLLGFCSRLAAIFGALLSFTLWLSTTWQVQPFFLGSDLPYAMGWLVLALAGPHPVWSVDALLQRRSHVQTPAPAIQEVDPASGSLLARRRFIATLGVTGLAGLVTSVAWANGLRGQSSKPEAVTLPATTSTPLPTPLPATATPAPAVPTATPSPAATTGAAPTALPTPTPPVPTATPVASSGGQSLFALSSLPQGEAKNFTTPDTREKAIALHLADGSVTAFSTLCTHEQCEVEFFKKTGQLVCPCHESVFDVKTGKPLEGPAPLPLKAFSVHVDANGMIVYGK